MQTKQHFVGSGHEIFGLVVDFSLYRALKENYATPKAVLKN